MKLAQSSTFSPSKMFFSSMMAQLPSRLVVSLAVENTAATEVGLTPFDLSCAGDATGCWPDYERRHAAHGAMEEPMARIPCGETIPRPLAARRCRRPLPY